MGELRITCPHCGYSKAVPADKVTADRMRVTCPTCKTPFVFEKGASETTRTPEKEPSANTGVGPKTGAEIRITCPHCGYSKGVPADKVPAGRMKIKCPGCGKPFVFERPSARPASPHPEPPKTVRPARPAVEPDIGTARAETAAVSPPQTSREAPEPAPAAEGMRSPGELLSGAWQSLRRRAGTLYGLLLFMYLMPVAVIFLFMGAGYLLASALPSARGIAIAGCGAAGLAAYIAAVGLCVGSLFYAVCDDELRFRDALGVGRLRMGSFVWAGLLVGLMVAGGSLLFIIPGIVFSVWFAFSLFVLADEGETGMSALLKSREYVRGRGMGVFGRLLVVWAASFAGMVPLVGLPLVFLLTPLMLLYMHGMYRDLRAARPMAGFAPPIGERIKWASAGVLGILFIPLLVVSLTLSFTVKNGVSFDQMMREFGLDRAVNLSIPRLMQEDRVDAGLVEAYAAYRNAIDDGDTDALRELLAPDAAGELDGPGGEMMVEMIGAFSPDNVTPTSSEINGDSAILHVESWKDDGVFSGSVRFVRDSGVWKVENENWDLTPKPRPVRLTGGKEAPGFSPIPEKFLSGGAVLQAEPQAFFNADDEPREVATLTGHEAGVSAIAFTPAGDRLVSACYSDSTVKIWDLAHARELGSIKLEHRPVSMALSPDGGTLVMTDTNQNLSFIPAGVYQFYDGQRFLAELGHEPRVAVSPNGRLLATTSFDRIVTIWDVEKRKELRRFTMPEPMRAVSFSPSGTMLAAGSAMHSLTLWDLSSGTGRTYATTKVGKDSDISAIAISPDSKSLVTGHMDSSIVAWDLAAQEELFNFYVTGAATMDAKFSPDGGIFATAHANNEIYLWEPSTARKLMTLAGHQGLPAALAFSPDGRYMASCDADGKIVVWGRQEISDRKRGRPDGDAAARDATKPQDNGSGASVWLDKAMFSPGESLAVHFIAPEEYGADAWIGIIPSDVPHGSEADNDARDIAYQYVSGRTSGDMSFKAPARPGRYDIRMHDTDADGTEVAYVTFRVKGADDLPGESGSEDYVSYYPDEKPEMVMLYVYSLNYKGRLTFNDREFYEIKGVRNMNYNSQTPVKLLPGQNTVTLEYEALPDAQKTEIRIKVLVYGKDGRIAEVPAEWIVTDRSGIKEYTLDLSL